MAGKFQAILDNVEKNKSSCSPSLYTLFETSGSFAYQVIQFLTSADLRKRFHYDKCISECVCFLNNITTFIAKVCIKILILYFKVFGVKLKVMFVHSMDFSNSWFHIQLKDIAITYQCEGSWNCPAVWPGSAWVLCAVTAVTNNMKGF